MALQREYNLKVTYTNNLTPMAGIPYESILTQEQSTQLKTPVEKVFLIGGTYNRIDYIEGSKDVIKFRLGVYKDSSKEKLISTDHYSFTPNTDAGSENFIKQGYEYLKTLPDFTNAIDVLEEGQTA